MLDKLAPYIAAIKAALIVGVIIGVFSFGHHTGAKGVHAEWSEARTKAKDEAVQKEREWNTKLKEAQDAGTKREAAARTDATNARGTAARLRNELETTRRELPNLAEGACRQRADTLAELFGQCSERYIGVAEKAVRHANDVQTLTEGWPK